MSQLSVQRIVPVGNRERMDLRPTSLVTFLDTVATLWPLTSQGIPIGISELERPEDAEVIQVLYASERSSVGHDPLRLLEVLHRICQERAWPADDDAFADFQVGLEMALFPPKDPAGEKDGVYLGDRMPA